MKNIYMYIVMVLLSISVNAQNQTTNMGNLQIHEGATIAFFGDFANNGTFADGGQVTIFGGSMPQTISGSSSINFFNLTINNSSGAILQKNINVSGNLQLIAGDLDLRNNNIDLGLTGSLVNETNSHRIKATNGISEGTGTGTVSFNKNLSAGAYTNIGGLGLDISTATDMDTTAIIAGFKLQTNGTNTSIARYFDITPQNNSGLNATLRFYYLDAETVGQDETDFVLWKSEDSGLTWSLQTPSTIDNSNNYVEKTGIISFSRWTISNKLNSPLPIELLTFDAKRINKTVNLNWKTASEKNNYGYEVERTTDMVNWEKIGFVKGAGSSNEILNYTYDNELVDEMFLNYKYLYYRLKQIDFDGDFAFTEVKSIALNATENIDITIETFPNPATDYVYIVSNQSSTEFLVSVFTQEGLLIGSTKMIGSSLVNVSKMIPSTYIFVIINKTTGKRFESKVVVL